MNWGPVRILRGRLEDDGYHTEEYRMISHIMIHVTGSRPSEIASPPAWRGARQALHWPGVVHSGNPGPPIRPDVAR